MNKKIYLAVILLGFLSTYSYADKGKGETSTTLGGNSGGSGGGGSGGTGGSLGAGGQQCPPQSDEATQWNIRERTRIEHAAECAKVEKHRKELYENRPHNLQRTIIDDAKQDRIVQTLKLARSAENRMEPAAYSFIGKELMQAYTIDGEIAFGCIHDLHTAEMLYEYSKRIVINTEFFLKGVLDGTIHGIGNQLVSLQQTAEAIYKDPTMIAEVGNNIVNIVSRPENMVRYAQEMYRQWVTLIRYGDAYSTGFASGNFLANTFSTIAVGESRILGMALDSMSKNILKYSHHDQIMNGVHHGLIRKDYGHVVEKIVEMDRASQGGLRGWDAKFKVYDIESAAQANSRLFTAGYYIPPYASNTRVIHFTVGDYAHFVRVHTENTRYGSWVMREDALKGMTPRDIQIKYSLPDSPTLITDVTVPPGTHMTRGHVGDNLQKLAKNSQEFQDFRTPPGTIQYRLEQRISTENYTNTRPIGDRFNE